MHWGLAWNLAVHQHTNPRLYIYIKGEGEFKHQISSEKSPEFQAGAGAKAPDEKSSILMPFFWKWVILAWEQKIVLI